jgi:hypothetical protein
VNGKEKERHGDQGFLQAFGEARSFMRKPEVENGERAIFDGNVEESEERKLAAMKEKLPEPVKLGVPFNSLSIVPPVRRKNPKSQKRGGQRLIAAALGRGRGHGANLTNICIQWLQGIGGRWWGF